MNTTIGDINNVFIELSSSTVCNRLTYQILLHKGYPSYIPRTHFDASRERNIYGTYNVTEGEKNLSNTTSPHTRGIQSGRCFPFIFSSSPLLFQCTHVLDFQEPNRLYTFFQLEPSGSVQLQWRLTGALSRGLFYWGAQGLLLNPFQCPIPQKCVSPWKTSQFP